MSRTNSELCVFSLQEKMPLAVVGSNVVIEVNGKKVRGRQYPWGVAEGRCTPGEEEHDFQFVAKPLNPR